MSAEPTPLRSDEDSPHTPLLSDVDRYRLVAEAFGDRQICRQCGATVASYTYQCSLLYPDPVSDWVHEWPRPATPCEGYIRFERAAFPPIKINRYEPASNVVPFPTFGDARTVPDPYKPWTAHRASDTIEPPPPEWIYDGLIMRGQVTLVSGAKAVGKTLALQELLSAAAAGVPVLGRHMERCRGFLYACEDTHDWLARRQTPICQALGIDVRDLEELCWVSRAADDCRLVDFKFGRMEFTDEWHHLWKEIERQESEFIVIDTARAVFGNGNENNASHVTPFVRALQMQAIKRNAAVALAVNTPTGNTKPFSGSGAWHTVARGGLVLERPRDYDEYLNTPPDQRLLRGFGANYSGGRSTINLRYQDGAFVTDDPAPPRRAFDQTSLDILDQEIVNGMYRTRNNGGKVYADVMHRLSMPNRYRATFNRATPCNDLYSAQDRMLLSGRIKRVNVDGDCIIRVSDSAPYPDETPWQI